MGQEDPTTSFPYYTTVTKPFHLRVEERVFLTMFEVFSTVLTILLNLYLLYIIIVKMKTQRSSVFIPMTVASLLGLFHGFGVNLIMTISLVNKEWVGEMDWCGAVANLHKYIIYTIIFCQVLIVLESAYLISHPYGYTRTSRQAKHVMCIATLAVLLIDLPITICQFFFLYPDQLKAAILDINHTFDISRLDVYYYYDTNLSLCYRWFVRGTADFNIIVWYIHAFNLLAVFLVIASYITITFVVCRMRKKRQSSPEQSLSDSLKQKERRQRVNKKIAIQSIVSTACVCLPWLLSMIVSFITNDKDIKEKMRAALDQREEMALYRTNQFIYYFVPWVFPLTCILWNPPLYRITRDIVSKLDLASVLPDGFHEVRSPIISRVITYNVNQADHKIKISSV